MRERFRRPARAAGAATAAALTAALVAACGVGGGKDPGSAATVYNQWGLRAIGGQRAYTQLAQRRGDEEAPGSGQTVGAIDSGIDALHPMFDGNHVTEVFLSGAVDETGDRPSHGTAVASVIVGNPSDQDAEAIGAPHGVAWGADIAMFAVPTLPSGIPGTLTGPAYRPIALEDLALADASWSSEIDTVLAWSEGGRTLDFVNVSLGHPGPIALYSETDLRDNLGGTLAALAQAGAGDKTVFVWAAGNNHGGDCDADDLADHPGLCVDGKTVAASPQIMAGLPARIAELRGHSIAVVAIDPNGEIADFSNRCGIAAEWCIAAPGTGIKAAYFGPDPSDGSVVQGVATSEGTSFAAPMVTGSLAVMKHFFRDQLSNTDLVARMMATATKTDIYADRDIYGQGLLDLGAATAPVGAAAVAAGAAVDGPAIPLAGTRFALGGALGDGLARSFAGHEIAAFDSLGAPFWYSLGALAGAAPAASAATRLRAFTGAPDRDPEPDALGLRFAALRSGGPVSLGVMRPRGSGHLSLAGGALALKTAGREGLLRIAAFSTEGMKGRDPATGAALSWRPGGSRLALTGGWLAERRTLLGSRAAGAFGRLAGRAAFAGIRGAARLGSWRIGAGAEIGTVRAAAEGGVFSSISPLTTSAFALRAERVLGIGGRLRVSLAQPLRVEAGRARLWVPVGRSRDGRVLRRAFAAGIEPSGRQIDLALRWNRSLAKAGEVSLGAVYSREPGHDADADPDLNLLAGWRYAF